MPIPTVSNVLGKDEEEEEEKGRRRGLFATFCHTEKERQRDSETARQWDEETE